MTAFIRRAAMVASPGAWALVGVTYVLTVLVSVRRFWQWGPDSRYYLAWAYKYGGLSEAEAGRRTYEFLGGFSWFQPFCHGACGPHVPAEAYDQLFHGHTGGLGAMRLLYPLLSAPFVRLFGPYGMLVVPLIAYAVCVALVMILTTRLVDRAWSVLAAMAMLLPLSVARFATYAYTEALAMALMAACLCVLPLDRPPQPRHRRRDLALLGVFLTLFAFTRQFHPTVVAGVALAWLGAAIRQRRLRNDWLPLLAVAAGVAAVCSLIQSLLAPDFQVVGPFLRYLGADSIHDVPALLPAIAWQIIKAEAFSASADGPLVVLTALAVFAAARRPHHPLAQYTTGAVLVTFALSLITAEGSDFRYYAITTPMLAILATTTVAATLKQPPTAATIRPAPDASPTVSPAAATTNTRSTPTRVPEQPASTRAETEADTTQPVNHQRRHNHGRRW
ncbi:MAG TPA: hypothetical protein VFC00_20800 [Micromonosporaceae bacterium]|nr:hypothetical protein [Micromonosporaceae bacterium]